VEHEKVELGVDVTLKGNEEVESTAMLSRAESGPGEKETRREEVTVSGDEPKVELVPAKEISSGSLQNPSDPDASFSGHKGQGYHAQIVETYSQTDGTDSDEHPLNLITYVSVEGANEPDSAALIPAVDALIDKGLAPEVIAADTAYGGDSDSEYAAAKGIELLGPDGGGGTGKASAKKAATLSEANKIIDTAQLESVDGEISRWVEAIEDESVAFNWIPIRLADFTSTKRGVIKCCPMGKKAKEKRYSNNRGGRAYFERAVRVKCPHCCLCPITISLNKAWLAYHDDQVRLDKRRAYQETNEFKDRYRWRSGVEATKPTGSNRFKAIAS
jgi:hypothetical protein